MESRNRVKLDREELKRKMHLDIANSKEKIAKLMKLDLLDEDGYPSEAALEIVEIWHWTDSKGWFEFIKSLWYMSSWGWEDYYEPHEIYKDRIAHRYNISTAGWSGNESIIRAMQKNSWMWEMVWVQSRRGGHYIFEEKNFDETEAN